MTNQSTYQQITNLINKKDNILILTHAKADCDGLGAALSAYLALKQLGKKVTVVTNDPTPENLQFLPSIDILSNSLANSNDFIITVDSSKSGVEKIKYNVEGNKVNIIITPKNGIIDPTEVSFGGGKSSYDLILIFDTGNLEHLGQLYDNNVEMFYETPIINIDHHASNTDFGQVNLVDTTAASSTEVFYEYLTHLEKTSGQKLITEDIATLLLAGIITDTGSFQHANTSPRAMETSAKLLDLGARQQEVIKNIYKTKKLSTLKLWGIVLSKVQVDPIHRMVWSALSKNDFQEAGAEPDETEGIIDDLLTNAPGAEVIFLIKENPEYTSISMRSTSNQIDVGRFCAENDGGGHVRAAGFKVKTGQPFDQIVSDVIQKVQKFQADRLQLHADQPTSKPSKEEELTQKKKEEKVEKTPSEIKPEANKDKETYLNFGESNQPSDQLLTIENKPKETAQEKSQDQQGQKEVTDIDFELPKDQSQASISSDTDENKATNNTNESIELSGKSNQPTSEGEASKKRRRRRRPRKKSNESEAQPTSNTPSFPTPPPIIQ